MLSYFSRSGPDIRMNVKKHGRKHCDSMLIKPNVNFWLDKNCNSATHRRLPFTNSDGLFLFRKTFSNGQ